MSAIILLCCGILVLIAEIFFASFFLLFISFGIIITAGIEYFIGFSTFGDVYVWQSLSILFFSFISLISLRRTIKSWFLNSQKYNDPLENNIGIGEIKEGMVYFKGTLWAYSIQKKSDTSNEDSPILQEGDKVKVIGMSNNKLIIQV